MNHPLTACISEIELLHERIAEKNARIEALEAALILEWAAQNNRIEALEKARDCAERALGHAGWSYTEGAEEWKPPLGPSAAPLLDRIEALEAALRQSDEALDQMIIWMPSGFAPQSQANAMRLAYEARKVARAALAPEQTNE